MQTLLMYFSGKINMSLKQNYANYSWVFAHIYIPELFDLVDRILAKNMGNPITRTHYHGS